MTEQWQRTQAQERAYTAGWHAFVVGATIPESVEYPGLRKFVLAGWNDAEQRAKTQDIYWSHPAKLAEPRPKRP